ncbi:MAG: hypothetical protein NVS4B3_17890 [Gemmatimonadaceae bacterium]
MFQCRPSLKANSWAYLPALRFALGSFLLGCGKSNGVAPTALPHIDAITPTSAPTGAASFVLTISGTGFTSGSMVRWNGVARVAIPGASPITQLTVGIFSSDLPASGAISVQVVNPGGAASNIVTFTINNPLPILYSMTPAAALAGSGPTSITVFGNDFTTTSIGRWNGAPRTTTFVSAQQVSVALTAADLAAAGTVQVTVATPTPGGGVSAPATFTINNPFPTTSSLSPAYVPVGAASFNLTVAGSGFVNGSVVRWNGADRITTYVSANQLTAAIPASDLNALGTSSVTVFTPAPGGGTSSGSVFTVGITSVTTVAMLVNDLVYDPSRQRLYASVAQTDPTRANTIARINPATGIVEATLSVGSDPGRLALSGDGLYLYVGLRGAGSVIRVDLGTFTVGLQFSLGNDPNLGARYVEEMAVLPGTSTSVAVSRRYVNVSPTSAGAAIYDNGVARTTATPDYEIDDEIAFGASANTLYSIDNETTGGTFRRLAVAASGLTSTSSVNGLVQSFGVLMRYANGRLYLTNGQVIDPVAGTTAGRCTTGSTWGAVQPDSANSRAFLLDGNVPTLRACDAVTFASHGTLTVPGVSGSTGALARWGSDGIAFSENAKLVLVRTNLVTAQ